MARQSLSGGTSDSSRGTGDDGDLVVKWGHTVLRFANSRIANGVFSLFASITLRFLLSNLGRRRHAPSSEHAFVLATPREPKFSVQRGGTRDGVVLP